MEHHTSRRTETKLTRQYQTEIMARSNRETSTVYPGLHAANPRLPSLANYPLDIVLLIIEALFEPRQIITVEIFALGLFESDDMTGIVSRQTKFHLHRPPLTRLAAVSRLFRYVHRKSRPTLWGAHLTSGRAYHVDLARDIFEIRAHRTVNYAEWDRDGDPLSDHLAGILAGIEQMATNDNYLRQRGSFHLMAYLRHLNPLSKQIIILFPSKAWKITTWLAAGWSCRQS